MNSNYYYLMQTRRDSLGWLGGNAPAWFDENKALVEEGGIHYGFYCTFTINDTQSLSVLIPERFKHLLDHNI